MQDVFRHKGLSFYINNSAVEYVEQWPHLGHVISSDLDDKHDINRGRSALVSQINNVLCFLRMLDSITKIRVFISYCYGLYGCIIWDITNVHVEQVCSAWRAGVHHVWGLPLNTHNVLIPLISNRLPLYDEIRKCMLTFI